ncbi:tRNA(Met) cytidine acetyltransferase TmcA [Hyperthermus butylicus]|uniref:tRNA(Met) cytidine acetyltransferase TmcA n=1 Tax=Hyperthermus butylicus (strain DSM 5456 / JCM 9403 / PLM1-5) TaxID=415426 RepID=A2BLE0_HYPBU|nr:tRNA(Met) cytidine acetyltransferase TmcA [Hyperthermus butylicus]ABM80801.1 putative P-loop ATPase fused to an acetyltransferase [Hyperthermus butylicus DSM 5456]
MESLPAEYSELGKKDIENLAKNVAEELKKYVPSSFNKLLRKLSKAIERAIVSRHRRLLVVTGTDPVEVAATVARALLFYERVYRRLKGKEPLPLLYVFHDEFKDAKIRKEVVKRTLKAQADMIEYTIARYEESDRYLGTTFKLLVMDLVNDLKPNDVGRLVGIVEGGGLIVFMVPPWSKWDKWITIFKQNLVVPGYNEPRHVFISWFKRKLLDHKGIFIFDTDDGEIIKADDYPLRRRTEQKIEIPEKTEFPRELYELALTQDQVNVIKVLESLLEKPKKKRRAIIITSDRGRGKSGAVGIASIGLAARLRKELGRVRIVVTAPNLSNVQSFFTLALKAAEKLELKTHIVRRGDNILEIHGKGFSIEYWEPIHVPRLKADIVIVDEAAGMHIPLLHKIWRSHRKLVFATTIHGYEGAGRGFSVRFLPALKNDPNTELIEVEMHEPIRYAEDDPIERWLFDALLLDAEPAELDEEDLKAIEAKQFEYVKFEPRELFSPEGEKTLRQLFGIYVLAHYRNEPDDLAILADAPHHIIRGVRLPSGKIVCALQIAQEGGLDDEMVEELLRGGKTPGNIIPDRTLKHLRVREFGHARGWRIVRIATHPEVQGRGIGSFALEKVYEEAKELGLDWVGSGFGVNEQLLKFWVKNGFYPVHMSPDRNPVSGEYTILVIKPITETMTRLVDIANREFKRKLLESLHDPYRDLEPEVAMLILKTGNPIFDNYYPALTPIQVDRLWIYAYGPMTYEAVADVLHELIRAYWIMYPKTKGLSLSKKEEYIAISKVLQGRSWDSVAEGLHTRPHSVMVALKELARKILKHYYGKDSESPVGIPAESIISTYEAQEFFVKPRQLQHKSRSEEQSSIDDANEREA